MHPNNVCMYVVSSLCTSSRLRTDGRVRPPYTTGIITFQCWRGWGGVSPQLIIMLAAAPAVVVVVVVVVVRAVKLCRRTLHTYIR